jgi:hypothetical protein
LFGDRATVLCVDERVEASEDETLEIGQYGQLERRERRNIQLDHDIERWNHHHVTSGENRRWVAHSFRLRAAKEREWSRNGGGENGKAWTPSSGQSMRCRIVRTR